MTLVAPTQIPAQMPSRIRYDDFVKSPNFETHELVHGVPQERHVGFKSDFIATRVVVVLDRFCSSTGFVIEVLSPGDVAVQVEAKIQEYLRFGVKLVWVLVPETRSVRIHRADGTVSLVHERDTISGEAVLEGFTCPVADFFPAGT